MIDINISNLKEGQTIKNYKELCNVLEINKATNTTYKNKQLEELSLYCNFERKGNKYIIKEIYKQPTITINDILKTKNSKYIKLLSDVLLEQLYKQPKELEQVPLIKLFTLLGVVNDNYKHANSYRKELSQLYNIQLASIYYFYSTTRNEFKKIIERCLNNLQKRSVLFWSKCIMIVKNIDGNKVFHKADKETEKLILDTQKEVLKYLNFNNMADLMQNKKKLKEFNKLINQELDFNYYFAYDITIGEKAIKIEYDSIQKERNNLNRLMISKSYNMFDKDYYKNFQNDYSNLIKLLIDINCDEDIKELLEEQYTYNFNMYLAESMQEDKKYNAKMAEIKEKYFDTYIN